MNLVYSGESAPCKLQDNDNSKVSVQGAWAAYAGVPPIVMKSSLPDNAL